MQCDRARELIGAWVDGELAGDDRVSVGSHVETCTACRDLARDIRRTSKMVAELGREPTPGGLAESVRRRLAAVGEPDRTSPFPRHFASTMWRQAAALAACCALSVLLTWLYLTSTAQADRLEQELLAAHMRSLLQDAPFQVASSDSHTVKPWFAGKVDFAPEVKDLTPEGYPLLGGRLDYVHQRRVGALVYKRRLHIINVFMWRAPAGENIAPLALAKNGYNLVTWSKNGVTYWAVSDLDAAELKRLANLL
jgi:anti-sigma factor RsiW